MQVNELENLLNIQTVYMNTIASIFQDIDVSEKRKSRYHNHFLPMAQLSILKKFIGFHVIYFLSVVLNVLIIFDVFLYHTQQRSRIPISFIRGDFHFFTLKLDINGCRE